MTTSIFDTVATRIKHLRQSLNLNDNVYILSGSVDPTSVAQDAPASSIYLQFGGSTGLIYQKNDAGSTTNWTLIGSSSSSGINYIANGSAESGTTGWVTYADAAGAKPVDGTGGSPTVTWTRSTTTPLRSSGDFNFTKDAANRQGEGVAYAFSIASADKAKILNITAEYEVVSGTYSGGSDSTDSDLTFYIYDVTNSVVIQPAAYKIAGSVSGQTYKFSGIFQTSSNSTSYRLIIHTATTSASAYVLAFDSVSIGPQITTIGAPITDWISFTPTGTWSANTTYTGRYRRDGDSMELEATAALTGAPVGTFTLNLPSGFTIDTTKLSNASTTGSSSLGVAGAEDGGAGVHVGKVSFGSTTSVRVQGDDGSDLWSATVPITFGNTDFVNLRATVPILGWSSTVQMSSDVDARVIKARYEVTASAAIAAGAVYTPTNKIFDTHGAFNTSNGKFTCPVAGFYKVTAGVITVNNASGAITRKLTLTARINGSSNATMCVSPSKVLGATANQAYGSTTVQCNAGDFIEVFYDNDDGTLNSSATQRDNFVLFEKEPGAAIIASSETIACAYATSVATSLVNNTDTVMVYATKDYDTHGAYNTSTGRFVAPVRGKYQITAGAALAADNGWAITERFSIEVRKNGTSSYPNQKVLSIMRAVSGVGIQLNVWGTADFDLLAGDFVEIYVNQNSGGAIALDGSAINNHMQIKKVG